LITLGLGLVLAVAVSLCALEVWWRSTVRKEANGKLARQDFAAARPLFAWLASRWGSDGEVRFQLGVCEQALGHDQAARQAWDAVPGGSPFASPAAMACARQELSRHRLAAAEPFLIRALEGRGPDATEAFETLVHVLKIEGRYREARRLVLRWWEHYRDRTGVLKELAHLEKPNPYAPDRARENLTRAAAAAPEDDRIWLGFANLAIRGNDFVEAEKWLDRCDLKRPGDAAVGRARLMLALATSNADTARKAVLGLRSDDLDPDEVLRLLAWFAGRSGDAATERAALSDLLLIQPDDAQAMERLTERAFQSGDTDGVNRLRTRKGEYDRARAEYEELLLVPGAPGPSARLAHLAEILHRPVEARLIWMTCLAARPGDSEASTGLARVKQFVPPPVPPTATLPQLLAYLDESRAGRSTGGTGAGIDSIAALPSFTDQAQGARIRFTFDNGAEPLHHLPEIYSGGVGLLDYDGDGWLDVFVVQGGPFPPSPGSMGGDRLFRNRRDGTFEDVTAASRISNLVHGYGHGVTVGDYDNDGRPDLFLTRWRAYTLLHNRGDGTFEDATEAAGLAGERDLPTSAAFADLDNDGDLDLYVCHYAVWDLDHPALCPRYDGKGQYQYADPRSLVPLPDHLFRNDRGDFTDVTKEAGIVDNDGRGLGVVIVDLDEDGKDDIFVSNDTSANYLFHNLGGMRFEETALLAGVASNASGGYMAGMGVACGDLDGDCLNDLVVANFYGESMSFYRNLGQMVFADHTANVGLDVPTRTSLGFGTAFLDANNDGYLDLAVTNGHVNDFRPEIPFEMPSQLFLGGPTKRLTDVSARAGAPWLVPRIGRGLAVGDLDNDGRLDLLILGQNQPLAYFHNQTSGGHSITLRLEGAASNRDAVGARAVVEAGGRRLLRERFGGGSFQSASDSRLHFGLGSDGKVDRLEIRWPSGRVDRFADLTADMGYLIREGDEHPRPLAGFRAIPER
jgi:tetratricopeptide (TPR) repeat protein